MLLKEDYFLIFSIQNSTNYYLRMVNREKIIQYYQDCDNAYRDAWGMDQNMQLNLGLWKPGTKNLSQALKHLNLEMETLADIKANDRVLDAGCGVGGTAIFLAKSTGCQVVGISLTPHQVEQARKNAQEHGVGHLCEFLEMDFMQMDFDSASFNVVIGMESICYAEPKSKFLQEAFRVLKPMGRLVLAENLQGKAELNPREYDELYTWAFNGCEVISLDTADEYLKNLKTAGFQNYECLDYTDLIRPSIKRLRRFFYPAWAYNQFHRLIGKPFSKTQEANTKMCYYLQTSLKKGLWTYGLIRAVK